MSSFVLMLSFRFQGDLKDMESINNIESYHPQEVQKGKN